MAPVVITTDRLAAWPRSGKHEGPVMANHRAFVLSARTRSL
jgi:hypothetical protein